MKKEEIKFTEQLSNFQRLLSLNYSRVAQLRDCITDNEISGLLQTEKTRLSELKHIEQEWEKLSVNYHKKQIQKLKSTQPITRQTHIAKHQNSLATQKERYLFSIKSTVKKLASHSEQKIKPKISIKDMVMLYRKVEEDGTILLMPVFNQITDGQAGVRESRADRPKSRDKLDKFVQISNKLSYNISMINLRTAIVCNFFMKIDNYADLETRIKSSDFELELYAFNFHSLFEPTLNYKASEVSSSYYLNINSNANIEAFYEFLGRNKQLSLQLSVSKFEYFNQLTTGCRAKVEDLVVTNDLRMYYFKIIDIIKRYLDHGLGSKYYPCNTCSKIAELNDNGEIVYPVYNLGKEFYHERCMNILHRNHASQ